MREGPGGVWTLDDFEECRVNDNKVLDDGSLLIADNQQDTVVEHARATTLLDVTQVKRSEDIECALTSHASRKTATFQAFMNHWEEHQQVQNYLRNTG